VTDRRLDPPSGEPPPASGWLDGDHPIDLPPLAAEICLRYRQEFPDEAERYGDAGMAWCVHDTQYLLFWAAEAVDGFLDLTVEVGWLAGVLEARDFPLDRLARNLDIAAAVVRDQLAGPPAEQLAEQLTGAAGFVRSHETFLE
jgi:hypothetical protein